MFNQIIQNRTGFIAIIVDLLIVLLSFCLVQYMFNQYNLGISLIYSIIWVVVSVLTNKIKFSNYNLFKYYFKGLLIINVPLGVILILLSKQILPFNSIIYAITLIFISECLLYYIFKSYKKIIYNANINEQCEPIKPYKINFLSDNKDVKVIIETLNSNVESPIDYIADKLSKNSVILNTSNHEDLLLIEESSLVIIHNIDLNKVRHINTFFSNTNNKLTERGYIMFKCITSNIRNNITLVNAPKPICNLIILIDYIVHRVIPKLHITRKLYYILTKGKRRVLTRVETLGRLYRAGFEVEYEKVMGNEYYVLARKIKKPMRGDNPSTGPIICLKRHGKDGKMIGVYKLRTMHAYSEYIQSYIFNSQGLAEGGKFMDDYRITPIGKILRKTWLDELPMLINWVKGDMKLVGVRPLSNHYFSLYSKEMQELRTKVKPGLFPAGYAVRYEVKTMEDIEKWEKEYLMEYFKNPIRTDFTYLMRGIYNILSRKSKNNEV